MNLIIKVMRFSLKIIGTRAMQKQTSAKFAPGYRAVQQVPEHLRRVLGMFHSSHGHHLLHHVDTCRIRSEWDTFSAVSDSVKVRSVSRLRATDASITPQSDSAPPLATTVRIAEKAAGLINKVRENPLENEDLTLFST